MNSLLNWLTIPNFFNAHFAWHALPYILGGLPLTVELTIVSFVGALMLGFFLTLGQMSKRHWLHWLTRTYISFMRGVPSLVLLFILYFGLPYTGIQLDAFVAADIAFILNAAAFVSEVFRSAFMGVEDGQWAASYSLGMSYGKAVHYVILPQAFRIAIPALGNILLDMFKGTSLAAMVTVSEMFMRAKIQGGKQFDYMTVYLLVALIYWACCSFLTVGQNWLEKRLTLPTTD
ncbi:MAG: amino acid ABC transporter permease [Furfurilactobacillus sp.]|jgi:cystine transport system permease protein|uniref:amino acid ABC transporter permease n=1 Tax=Furfurilactobacillus sp. TaxID=2767911 RepID=UPI00258FCAF9|nr:amino acid ABC transporter permease [Furfurilactobacillus sp.]MCH4011995.1 amino acid ABC transporter permease [Furfurilactobacillus sp.]MCH4037887.1 amino acid ABC transporter permease [Furfurilactobacillus sp.]MCH4115476.1 amino acid ABC transporter permease [Furfurilactobacillus sp.]MCI1341313.1 amino acid ABC transporter permease [Furfurilactobacillus sp.]MCI1388091.1 amino acid ABC transporter permease [Furfurilactobacillus sp.]